MSFLGGKKYLKNLCKEPSLLERINSQITLPHHFGNLSMTKTRFSGLFWPQSRRQCEVVDGLHPRPQMPKGTDCHIRLCKFLFFILLVIFCLIYWFRNLNYQQTLLFLIMVHPISLLPTISRNKLQPPDSNKVELPLANQRKRPLGY